MGMARKLAIPVNAQLQSPECIVYCSGLFNGHAHITQERHTMSSQPPLPGVPRIGGKNLGRSDTTKLDGERSQRSRRCACLTKTTYRIGCRTPLVQRESCCEERPTVYARS